MNIKKYIQYKRIVKKLNKNSYLAFMCWDSFLRINNLNRRLRVERMWSVKNDI